MTDTTTNRPLVTFALFAYNQERYVREAVEGAFAQTYEPLEIILSDDCSTDRTFAIMQDMADAYEGPHNVRAVRTPRNLGVTSHVLLRGKEASGELVVVAAGDDISTPERTAEHSRLYSDNDVLAVSGAFDLIDDQGVLLSKQNTQPISRRALQYQRSLFGRLIFPYVVIQGSTASYRRRLFDLSLPSHPLTMSEDNLFNFLIYAHGYRVAFVEHSLVRYRVHRQAMSNRPLLDEDLQIREVRSCEVASRAIRMMDTFEWIARDVGPRCPADLTAIRKRKAHHVERHEWSRLSVLQRVGSILKSVGELNVGSLKWKCARVLGTLPNYQPRSSIYRIFRR